jgi:uncharacterized protein YkwD
MLHLLRKLLAAFNPKPGVAPKTPPTFKPTVESLEQRETPTTGLVGLRPLDPVLHNGVLTVMGNDAANTIDFRLANSRIYVLGESFAAAQVQAIAVDGQDGNDFIQIGDSIVKPTYLFGGFGNDTIRGGSGVDRIFGGPGADSLFGRVGKDQLYGGAGADWLDGGAGDDFAQGGGGADTFASAYHSTEVKSAVVNYAAASLQREIVRLTNIERTNHGLAPLTLDSRLNYVAAEHASTLRNLRVPIGLGISHETSGDKRPTIGARLDANLIEYSTYSENNYWSTSPRTAQHIVQGWMSSPGHRANILNPTFTHIGVGTVGNVATGYYSTQVFARF